MRSVDPHTMFLTVSNKIFPFAQNDVFDDGVMTWSTIAQSRDHVLRDHVIDMVGTCIRNVRLVMGVTARVLPCHVICR